MNKVIKNMKKHGLLFGSIGGGLLLSAGLAAGLVLFLKRRATAQEGEVETGSGQKTQEKQKDVPLQTQGFKTEMKDRPAKGV